MKAIQITFEEDLLNDLDADDNGESDRPFGAAAPVGA